MDQVFVQQGLKSRQPGWRDAEQRSHLVQPTLARLPAEMLPGPSGPRQLSTLFVQASERGPDAVVETLWQRSASRTPLLVRRT